MAKIGDVDPADAVGISGVRDVVELEGTLAARVFVVVDERTARRVVIRVRRGALEGEALTRFEQRQDRVATLRRHPNIARVLTQGVNMDDLPFAVSEVVDGDTVAELIDRGRRFDLADAVRICVSAAGALESVARVDVRPGLLGPADLSLDREGEPVFSGLAVVERASAATVASARPDQIAFLAPELAEGDGATARSDVYALGALLYALLTGTLPFVSGGITREVLHRIIAGQIPDLRTLRIPAEVAEVVERAMATSPLDRYADALAFGQACQQAEIALGLESTQMLVKKDPAGSARAATGEPAEQIESAEPVESAEPAQSVEPVRPVESAGTIEAAETADSPPHFSPAVAPEPVIDPTPIPMSGSAGVGFLPPLPPYYQQPPPVDFEVLHLWAAGSSRSAGWPRSDAGVRRVPPPSFAPERRTRSDRRTFLFGAGVVVVLLLLGVIVIRTAGQGSESPEVTTSATIVEVGAFDQAFDKLVATDDTGVITVYAPFGWTTSGAPGQAQGVEMPTLVSAADPAAFVDPARSLETDGVRITVDPTAAADPAAAPGLLWNLLTSLGPAGSKSLSTYCEKVSQSTVVKIGGYSGSSAILGPCGPSDRALQVAVLVSDSGGAVVTFEGHAADVAHLGQVDQVLGSLAVAPR